MHGRGLRRGKEDLWDREFPGGVCKHRADPEVDRESRQTSDNQALDVGRLNNTNTTNNNPISPISPDGIDSKDSSKPKKDRRETTIKSVFGGFVSSVNDLLSNQKKVEVSAPYNPVHLTHVGFNSNTGEFTGLPKEWQIRLQESGTTKVNGELQFDDVWQKFGHVAEADLHQPLKDPSGVVFQNPRSAPAPPPPSRPNLALCSQTTLPPTGLTSASSMSRRPSDSNGPVTSPVQLTSSKSFTGRPSKSKARPNSLDAPSIHAQPFPAKLNNTVAKDIPIPQRPAPPKPLSSSKLGKSSSVKVSASSSTKKFLC
ncbi:signal transducing kinase of the PAK [Puccinia graminis f. sp. tritici]|uniref:non-specific serine/threonine protein kinase n=1 Tax=Puccinia graminis f. sp. tritici TaxID=56615 RepID=A0A5B0N0W5_PUCGR|nr:signal transducing kinase of the PAK [Puccinia graminis f. sp. tritici]